MENIVFKKSLKTSSISTYNIIASLHNKILSTNEIDIKIEIDIQDKVDKSFLFYISILPYLVIDDVNNNKTISIYANNRCIDIFKSLDLIDKSNKFVNNNTNLTEFFTEKSRLIQTNDDCFNIIKSITDSAPVEMSDDLSYIFISKIGEVFINAQEHSKSKSVVGTKYFKNNKKGYCFCCYDNGVGIPQNVREFHGNTNDMTDIDCLFWAMQRSNSTAVETIPTRGLGFELLKNFAQSNNGSIRICSGKVLYICHGEKNDMYIDLENEFKGTLFEMHIITDNNHKYVLS